jgi:hypothetical protein
MRIIFSIRLLLLAVGMLDILLTGQCWGMRAAPLKGSSAKHSN